MCNEAPAKLLARLTQAAVDAEKGPPGAGRDAALRALVLRACAAPWRTPEERAEAQRLVARLERLRWAADGARKGPAPA